MFWQVFHVLAFISSLQGSDPVPPVYDSQTVKQELNTCCTSLKTDYEEEIMLWIWKSQSYCTYQELLQPTSGYLDAGNIVMMCVEVPQFGFQSLPSSPLGKPRRSTSLGSSHYSTSCYQQDVGLPQMSLIYFTCL